MYNDRNQYPHPRLPKLSRAQLRDMDKPMWKRLRDVQGDVLAERELTLRVHGRETVANVIRGAHGLANWY